MPMHKSISAAPTNSWASRCAPRRWRPRRGEMLALARGLDDALKAMPKMPAEQMIKAFPKELFAGSDVKQFEDVLSRYKGSLYPDSVKIDLPAARRVADTLKIAGLVSAGADVSGLHDTSVVGG